MFGLGGSSQLGIGIAVALQNNFSGESNRVVSSMRTMRNESYRMNQQAMRDYRNYSVGIAASAAAATRAMGSLVSKGASYNQVLQQTAILSEGKLGRSALKRMSMNIATTFKEDPTKVVGAMLENVRAGVTDGMQMITSYQTAAAKASGEAPELVAEKLLGIANAMNIPMKQFDRVANATTAAANASMASVSSIGETMEYAAFAAHQFNIPLEQTLALVAKLSQAKITGSAAGTALNNMFQYLGTSVSSRASKKQIGAWKSLGIDQKEMRGMVDSGNIFGALQRMEQAMVGMAPSEKTSILRDLTNMRGSRGVLAAWGNSDPSKSLNGLLKTIQDGVKNDIAMSQAKKMMDSLEGDFAMIKVKWTQFAIEFTNAVEPMLRRAIPYLGKFLDWITGFVSGNPIGKFLAVASMAIIPVVGALFTFRAALLTATLALTGLSGRTTFGQVLRGGIGSAGGRQGYSYVGIQSKGKWFNKSMPSANYVGISPGSAYSDIFRKKRRWLVRPGSTYMIGTKQYGQGSFLPGGYNPNRYNVPFVQPRSLYRSGLSTWGAPLAAANRNMTFNRIPTGFWGRTTGLLGKVASGGSAIMGMLGGPWGLAIMVGMAVLPQIYNWLTSRPDPADELVSSGFTTDPSMPINQVYNRKRSEALKALGLGDQARQEVRNNINIYVDGQKRAEKSFVDQEESDIILSDMDQSF